MASAAPPAGAAASSGVSVRNAVTLALGLIATGLTYLVWLLAVEPIAWLDARLAGAWLFLLLAAFLLVHVARNLRPARARERELLRLDAPDGPSLGRIVLAMPFVATFTLTFGALLVYLGETPSDAGAGIPDYTGPLAWLPIALLFIIFAPLLEEFVFRGWVQHRLERVLGAPSAIALTALLFALAHGWNVGNLNRFVLGLAFGGAVWASRSIWAGVLLHAANNGAALLIGMLTPDSWTRPSDMIPWIASHGGVTPLILLSAVSAIGMGVAVLHAGGARPPARDAVA